MRLNSAVAGASVVLVSLLFVPGAFAQHVVEVRGADTKYRFADWNYTGPTGGVVDVFYVGVPGSNELNVGAGWAFRKGAFVVTPLACAVAGKEDGQLGVKLALLVAADRDGWKLAAFLADYIPAAGDVESYVVLDTLDFTRAIGKRWEVGVQAGFFKTGDAWNQQIGPLVKFNDRLGAWAASYRFGPDNEFRVGRILVLPSTR